MYETGASMRLSRPTQSVYRIAPRIPSIPFLPAGMPRLATGGAAATPPGGKGTPPPSPSLGGVSACGGPVRLAGESPRRGEGGRDFGGEARTDAHRGGGGGEPLARG